MACGSGQSDALKKRIAELEDRVSVLQNQDDAVEARLSTLETERSRGRSKALAAPAASTAEDRPLLQVVKLVPSGDAHPDRPDAKTDPSDADQPASSLGSSSGTEASRPIIRGTGNRLETHEPAAHGAPASGRPGPNGGKLPVATSARPSKGTAP
jgi:hypothetical protein